MLSRELGLEVQLSGCCDSGWFWLLINQLNEQKSPGRVDQIRWPVEMDDRELGFLGTHSSTALLVTEMVLLNLLFFCFFFYSCEDASRMEVSAWSEVMLEWRIVIE
jgi:hypothetical protein